MTKYTAQHEGQIATRKSDRVYTHAVFVRERLVRQLPEAKRSVEVTQGWVARAESPEARARYEVRVAESKAALAKLEARIAAGEEFSAWGVIGWCGRHDLAIKHSAHKHWCQTAIVPVTVI